MISLFITVKLPLKKKIMTHNFDNDNKMDESIFIENVSYILNEEEKTAKIKIFNKKKDHYIPRSIIYINHKST